jgi:hypothetical protein
MTTDEISFMRRGVPFDSPLKIRASSIVRLSHLTVMKELTARKSFFFFYELQLV